MLPSEAKKLKACLYSIHLELLRIRALIKKKTKSDYESQERQEKENRRQRQEDIEKVTRALYDLKPNEEEKKEARSQYNKSLSIQFLLMIGTFLAFFAAAYYANIARKQACIMNLTLAEIIEIKGYVKFDNGFGDWHTTQFCWRYLNGYSIPNRPMAPGGFVRCDQFLSEMNRIKTEIAAASRDAQKR